MPEKSLKRKVEVESIVPPKKKQKEEDSEATEKQEESEKREEVLDKVPSKPEVNTERIVSEEETNSSDEEKDDEEKSMLEEKMKNLFSLLDNKIPPPGKKPGISPYIRKKVPKPKRNSFEHEELSPRKSPAKQNPFKKLKTHAENDDNNYQDFSFDDESQEYINNSQVVVYVNPTEETGILFNCVVL